MSTSELRPTLIDRIVSRFSPEAGVRRLVARRAIENLQRGYDAVNIAKESRRRLSRGEAADSEIQASGGALREIMRDLVRNNDLAASATQVLVNNFVGSGIRPRANTSDKELNKRVGALWDKWAGRCDAHGHTDFHGVLNLAVRQMVESGECFAIRRRRAVGSGLPPLQIELREPDHMDETKAEHAGRMVRQGIEYDASGRRLAYWMFPEHPGGATTIFRPRMESARIAADSVAHLFERQRVQSRGVPWGTPAVRALHDLGQWQRAEMVRKKTEACLVGIVTGDEPGMNLAPDGDGGAQVVDSSGNSVDTFRPGMIAYLKHGTDVRFNNPAATGGIAEWNKVQMHLIAAGFRVPYSLMTGDLEKVSFSSSRVGLNEFRRMVEQVQWLTIIPMICEPIWRWFIDAAQTAGLLPDDMDIPAEWAPPRFEAVNPLQDANADLLEVRAGFTSPQQQIARRGYDPEAVMAEWKEFADLMDGMGLIFDSDPRRTAKAGNAQPGATPPEE